MEKRINLNVQEILDKEFQRIKIKMLEEIMKIDNKIIFSCYIKKEGYTNYQGDNLISRYVDLKIKNYTKNMVNRIKLILEENNK